MSTRSVEDEVVLVRERLRGGTLTDENVEAAACLGHEASRLVLGGTRDGQDALRFWWLGPDYTSGTEPRWSRAVERVGGSAAVRAGIAIARPFLSRVSSVHRTRVRELLRTAEQIALGRASTPDLDLVREGLANAELHNVVRILFPEPDLIPELNSKPYRRFWLGSPGAADEVRANLSTELIPWLLGHPDPLPLTL